MMTEVLPSQSHTATNLARMAQRAGTAIAIAVARAAVAIAKSAAIAADDDGEVEAPPDESESCKVIGGIP
eukprot:symbB.v1.2.031597.t1/scaffold3686.1/size52022/2